MKFSSHTDPFALLVAATWLCTVLACLQGIYACVAGLATGLLLLLFSRINVKELWGRFRAVNIFVLFMWLIVPLTAPGEELGAYLPFSVRGIKLCLLITLKANAILCVFTALLTQLTISQWGSALAAAHCPPPLAWLFLLMPRNIQILSTQWRILQDAGRLRSFIPRASLRTYRIYAAMLARFFLTVHDRAQILNNAINLRGGLRGLPFSGSILYPRADLYFLGGVFAVSALLIAFAYILP